VTAAQARLGQADSGHVEPQAQMRSDAEPAGMGQALAVDDDGVEGRSKS
jgi:hypothetical protein